MTNAAELLAKATPYIDGALMEKALQGKLSLEECASLAGQICNENLQLNSEVAELREALARERMNRKHDYWGAGEKDCPREIKGSNGELHTLRCKICGSGNPDTPCSVTDEEVDDYALIMRQGSLLTRTVNVLRGEPAPLSQHSVHDAPELAATVVAERDRLLKALRLLLEPSRARFVCECSDHDSPCDICVARAACGLRGRR